MRMLSSCEKLTLGCLELLKKVDLYALPLSRMSGAKMVEENRINIPTKMVQEENLIQFWEIFQYVVYCFVLLILSNANQHSTLPVYFFLATFHGALYCVYVWHMYHFCQASTSATGPLQVSVILFSIHLPSVFE